MPRKRTGILLLLTTLGRAYPNHSGQTGRLGPHPLLDKSGDEKPGLELRDPSQGKGLAENNLLYIFGGYIRVAQNTVEALTPLT